MNMVTTEGEWGITGAAIEDGFVSIYSVVE